MPNPNSQQQVQQQLPAPSRNLVREKLKTLMERDGMKLADVSRAINYKKTSLHDYITDNYRAGSDGIESALLQWFARQGDPFMLDLLGSEDKGALPPLYIGTDASEKVVELCHAANDERCIVAVVGAPGTGKTVGVNEFARQARVEGIRFAHISSNCMISPAHIMRRISRELSLAERGSAAQMCDRIIDKFRKNPTVLIVDESQHLNVRCLEAIRHLHDETGCGVAIIGSLVLYRTLQDGDDGHYELAQLQDRVTRIETIATLDHRGVGKFVGMWLPGRKIDQEAIGRFRAKSRGIARRLVKLLQGVRRINDATGGVITVDVIEEAEKKLVKEAN